MTTPGPAFASALADLLDPAGSADAEARAEVESDWHTWLTTCLPTYCVHPFGEHHQRLWEWVWSIEAGKRPESLVAVFPRGGAKSTSAEMAVAALGARKARRYVLYVSETQEQADDHVANVAALLESAEVEHWYPELGRPAVNKQGKSKGWRRNRIRTAHGFVIDACGLDSAARGIKFEDQRPDMLVLDDIDGTHDTPATTAKKVSTVTKQLIPAGSSDMAICAVQNLIVPDGMFSQLIDGRAKFMARRTVIGPVPALEGMATEEDDEGRTVIVAGTPTWEGQNVETCQAMVDDMGISAFTSECQHEVEAPTGGIFDHVTWTYTTEAELPALVRTVVWVDPAVTDTDKSDANGIQVDSLGDDGRIYRRWSWMERSSPLPTLQLAVRKAVEYGAGHVGVEVNQGGDTWELVFRQAVGEVAAELSDEHRTTCATDDCATCRDGVAVNLNYRSAHAASNTSKVARAQQMLADYERPRRIVHVAGTHRTLETALRRFPQSKPYDLVDAAYWAWADLRGQVGQKSGGVTSVSREALQRRQQTNMRTRRGRR